MILCETIPLHKLSTKYAVISTEPKSGYLSQSVVIALENNAAILINFKMKQNLPLNNEGNIFYRGDVFHFLRSCLKHIRLSTLPIYQGHSLNHHFKSQRFSGNDCNRLENIGTCGHLIEQLPPTDILTKIYNASEFE